MGTAPSWWPAVLDTWCHLRVLERPFLPQAEGHLRLQGGGELGARARLCS